MENRVEPRVLSSWAEFSRIAERVDVGRAGSYAYAFRGQSDAEWLLTPSLLRHLPPGTSSVQALESEATSVAEFKSQAHLYLPQSELATTTDSLSWLTVMQHHGAPTRLLDWTASIYVAAYFAVHGAPAADGAVWLVHTASVDEHMRNTHGSSGMPTTEDEIRRAFFAPDAPEIVTFVGRLNKSARMVAQQGLFSVSRQVTSTHGAVFERIFQSPTAKLLFAKLVVPASLKPAFARQLRSMNITAGALFPGVDGLGRSIAELLRIRHPNASA